MIDTKALEILETLYVWWPSDKDRVVLVAPLSKEWCEHHIWNSSGIIGAFEQTLLVFKARINAAKVYAQLLDREHVIVHIEKKEKSK